MSASAKDQVQSSQSEETRNNSATETQSKQEKSGSAQDSSKEGLEKSESQAKDKASSAKEGTEKSESEAKEKTGSTKDSSKEGAEKSEKGESKKPESGEGEEGGEDGEGEDRPRPKRKVQPSKEALEGPQGPPPKRYDYEGEADEKKGMRWCAVFHVQIRRANKYQAASPETREGKIRLVIPRNTSRNRTNLQVRIKRTRSPATSTRGEALSI